MSRYCRNIRVVLSASDAAAVPRVTKVVAKNKKKVFVVKQHHHQDFKCSESYSVVEDVFDSEIAAIKVCVYENIVKNTYYRDYSKNLSPTFVTALKEKFPARIIEIFGEEGVEDDGKYAEVKFTEIEIKETISELSFTKLETIFDDLYTSITERVEPTYSDKPTQYLFTYHEKIIRRDNGDLVNKNLL